MNDKKPLGVWHGDFMGSQLKYADREAMALVAKKTKDIQNAGGGCVVSRRFGMGPATIVLTIPSNVNPVRFFDEDQVKFTFITTIGEAPAPVDAEIKEVTGKDVVRPVAEDGEVKEEDVKASAEAEAAQSPEQG